MKKNIVYVLGAIIALCSVNHVFSGQHYSTPAKILLKNGSAFDIVYKPFIAEDVVYYKGKEVIDEKNIIKPGEFVEIPTQGHQPMRLSIKRYGYGSSLSPWVTVPNPTDLARAQLDVNQIQRYYLYTESKGKMPIITVKTGYTGGWSFAIGYTN